MKIGNLEAGIYINRLTGKGIVVTEDIDFKTGRVKLVKDKYIYFQHREGKKIKTTYIGLARCRRSKKCYEYRTKGEI